MNRLTKVTEPTITKENRAGRKGFRVRWYVDQKQFERAVRTHREAMALATHINDARTHGADFGSDGLPVIRGAEAAQITIADIAARYLAQNWTTWQGNTRANRLRNMAVVVARCGFDTYVDDVFNRATLMAFLNPTTAPDDRPRLNEINATAVPLAGFTRRHLREHATALYATVSDRDIPLGPSSSEHRRTCLIGIWELARDLDLLAENPVPARPKTERSSRRGMPNYPTPTELRNEFEKLIFFDRLLARLLLASGMRPGEGCGIKVHDLEFRTDMFTVTVNQSSRTRHARNFGDDDTGDPKTGRRHVPIFDAELADDLAEWIAVNELETHHYVFGHRKAGNPQRMKHPIDFTRPYSPDNLSNRWNQSGAKWNPYACRHSFHSAALSNGVPVAELCVLTGNTPQVVHRHYQHAMHDTTATAKRVAQALTSD